MAEDQLPDPADLRAQRATVRAQPTMSIHLPPSGALADAQPARLSPKLAVNGHDEISALKLVVPIVRRWPVILWTAALFGAAGLLLTYVVRPRYRAATTFTVDSNGGGLSIPKGMGGIGGQLGALLGAGMSRGPSPDYFTGLAESRTIRESVLASHYTRDGTLASSGGRPLLDLLDVEGATPARRRDNGVRKLDRMIRTEIDRRNGIVTLAVTDREPQRAAAIANRVLELLDKYNAEQRRSQSRQRRELAEARLSEVRAELRAAEERFQDFLSRNRRAQSPLLIFEGNRLERAVQQKQELAAALAQAYEDARISEAGDVPVISVIDPAIAPTRRSFPVRWQFLLAGLFLGGLVGLALVYLLEARRTWIAEQQPDFLALRDAAQAWKARLRGRRVRA